jgi:G:T-mismatch repair DNA endonuclease (very short patch repair protein)
MYHLVERPKKEQLEADYLKLTMLQIAVKYGVRGSTVSRWFKALGICKKGRAQPLKVSKRALETDYTEEATTRQLGNKYGVCGATIRNWLGFYGIPRHRRGYTAIPSPPKSKLRHLYLVLGLSTRKIGELYNVSCHIIRKWLENYGIPRFNKSFTNKRNWANPEFRDRQMLAVMAGLQRKPTRPEQQLIDIIGKYELPYKYTGDGSFIIGGVAPDFVNTNGAKMAIEVFGDYWHTKRAKYAVQTEKGRKARLAEYGWGLIVLWENELKHLTDQQIVERLSESQNKDKEVMCH